MTAELCTETKPIQELVIDAICEGLGGSRSDLINCTDKHYNSVFKRLLLYYFLRTNTELSNEDIARLIGKENGSQVTYAVRKIKGELQVRETITTRHVGLIKRLIDCKVQRREQCLAAL